MPVIDITTDPEALTMTVTAEFAAPPARAWELYADPRQLERWWGPPGWPATFLEHTFAAGGGSHYFMEREDGTRYYGVWRVIETEPTSRFVVRDAFGDADGNADESKGWTTMATTLAAATLDGGVDGTVVTMVSTFASAEQFEATLAMGMEEGLRMAMNQIDGLLAPDAA